MPFSGIQNRQLRFLVMATAPVALVEALLVVWSRGPSLVALPWVELAAQSFAVLIALAIAFFSFGRHRVLSDPGCFWVGLAFWAYALFGALHLATFPGALGATSLAPVHPNVAGWPYQLEWMSFAALLVVAVLARPRPAQGTGRDLAAFATVTSGCVAAGALVVALGPWLPPLEANGVLAGTEVRWFTVLMALAAVGALITFGPASPGRSAVTTASVVQVVAAIYLLGDLFGGRLFDLTWYLNHVLMVGSFSLMLLTLLAGYVAALGEQTGLARAAHASAARLRATFEGMTDAVLVLDAAGRVAQANARAFELLGCRAATEPLGPGAGFDQLLEVTHLSGRRVGPGESPAARALRGETVKGFLAQVRSRAGRELTVELTAAPTQDEGGAVTGAVLVARDVGEVVLARSRATVARVATAVAGVRGLTGLVEAVLTEVSAALDADGLALYTTDEASRTLILCGHRKLPPAIAERLSTLSFDAGSIGSRAVTTGRLQLVEDVRAIPAGLPFPREVAQHFGDGAMVAVPLRIHGRCVGALTYATGTPRQFSARDLETIQALGDIVAVGLQNALLEEAAEEERRRLKAVIDASPVGILLFGAPDGQLTYGNSAAERILGNPVKPGPLAPVPPGPALSHADGRPLQRDERPATRALHGEPVIGLEVFLDRDDGERVPLLAHAAPIRGPDGSVTGAVTLFQDISALKGLEQQREDFIHTVSHDLRTPLAIILGHAQILERTDATERTAKGTRAIITAVRRMNSMIQDLVDSARLEAGELKLSTRPLDLHGYLVELRDRLSAVIDVEHVRIEAPGPLPAVLADPDRLERIVTNLLSNAVKYSAPESEILVRLEGVCSEVLTSVIDHGRGIPADELPQLFHRYYRTREARARREGLGLGLFIVKGLVEAHRGRIWVESEPGQGSTFHFSLPAAARGEASLRDEPKPRPAPDHRPTI